MTDDEILGAVERLSHQVEELVAKSHAARAAFEAVAADNARLRGLVKDAEKGTAAFVMCPWCEMEGGGHFDSCPAFTTHLFTGKVVVR